MVAFIRSDLDFILQQIKIAEAHAAGQPLYGEGGLIPTYNLAFGLRTVDGSYNHLLPGQEHWGAADQPFPNHVDPAYRTIMVDPDGDGPMGPLPVSYTPGVDNDGPGSAGPSDVFDPYVRLISNLIVDQTLDNPAVIIEALNRNGFAGDTLAAAAEIKAAYQPLKPLFKAVDDAADAAAEARAAAEAAGAAEGSPLDLAADAAEQGLADAQTALSDARALDPDGAGAGVSFDALLAGYGVELSGANVEIPNVAPDEGLSAPFNSWFTLFGQFFDHGLDLVAKGGDGQVFIPLLPDDPLYVEGSPTNFMILTRASLDANGNAINLTTPFVDQNQTYSSHPSHQVFLREYEMGPDGPHATGDLIHGTNGGMATWGQLKAQASAMLGIELRDTDVGNLPLLRTDPYGNFIPGENGFPQVVVSIGVDGVPNTADDVVVEGNPDAPIVLATLNGGLGPVRTGHAFLDDIAHNAVPDGLEDGDTEVGGNIPEDGFYDDELLDAHYVAGDGRANENVGLTAVHHVFHAEHNRLVEHTKDVTIEDARQMLAGGASAAEAVAFLNEWLDVAVAEVPMDQAAVDALDWNGERLFQAAKFGTEMQYQHLVFEEFARKIQPAINTFLVPDGFDATMNPTIMGEFAHVVYRFGHSMLTESIDRYDAGFDPQHISLIQGFLNPLEFDPLNPDIAAGDIVRGMTRQVGNHIDEFVTSALRNNLLGLPLDLATINLARGRDTGVPTLNEARQQFYDATDQNELLEPYRSWVDFAGHLKNEASIINFIAAYGTHELITSQTTAEGRRDAALTIITGQEFGGLAVPADRLDFLNAEGAYAGGSLGGLQDVDFWIGGLAEETMPFGGMLGSTFNFVFEVQMEALQSGDRFYYLQRLDGLHLFGEMENNSFASMIMRNSDAVHLPSDVFSAPTWILEVDQALQRNDVNGDGVFETSDPEAGGLLTQLVIRDNPATAGPDANYLRYTGADHVVLGGSDGSDSLRAGIGDDTLYGDGGSDRLEGDFGNDIINGGDGDDIVTDRGGDDNIKGGAGNDAVHAGPGLDLVLAGSGKDFVVLGTDEGSEVFGGEGDDFILGNKNAERILGNEGNDWIETGTFDGAPGDNFDEIFAHDGIDGNDVFLGDGGFDEFIGEGGDDIMVGSAGRGKMVGMSGFDWATYKDNTFAVNANLNIPIVFDEAPVLPANASLDEYESMEGLSGSRFDDVLTGTADTSANRQSVANGGDTGYLGSILDQEGIEMIDGLQEVLGAGATSFDAGDIILGGAGSDLITGLAGDDIIDGDKWLNVRISVRQNSDGTGPEIGSANSMRELTAQVFAGQINPGQLQIVREILTADEGDDVDIAVFSDVFENYDVTFNDDGTITVAHTGGTQTDGTDTLRNIELLRFADVDVATNAPATGQPVISDVTPTEGDVLTVNTAAIADLDGLGPFSYQWQESADGITWVDIAGATGASFAPDGDPGQQFGAQAGLQLRVAVSFTDGAGGDELVVSNATAPVGVWWTGNNAANTLIGTAGDDIGNAGGGNDVMTGGGGSDVLNGNGGTDVVVFADPVGNYDIDLAGPIVVTDNVGTGGTDLLQNVEILRFNGTDYSVLRGNAGNNTLNNITNGTAGSQAIFAGAGNDRMNGGAGDDVIVAGIGNDTIYHTGATGGHDLVDGGAGTDTFVLNGVAGAETFRIYARAAAEAAGITGLNADTEIVITRNGTSSADVIAELDSIEEINVNALNVTSPGGVPPGGTGGNGGDTIEVIGDFNPTSLNFNTITVNGGSGNDTVDISALASDHRLVFNSGGGADTVLGDLRPQDVVPGPAGRGGTANVLETGGAPAGLTSLHSALSLVGAPAKLAAWMESEDWFGATAMRGLERSLDVGGGNALDRTLAWNSPSDLATLGNGRGNYLSIDAIVDQQSTLRPATARIAPERDDFDIHGLRHPGGETLDYLIP